MKVNLAGAKFREINGNWNVMYNYIISAFNELGYDVHKSKFLQLSSCPDYVKTLSTDSDTDIYVYNHITKNYLREYKFYEGKKALFIKPTGPTEAHFTIDTLGYAAYSSITFEKPNFETIKYKKFFNTQVSDWKESKVHKWKDRDDLQMSSPVLSVPNNHILIIGQMPGDETVTQMSFGDHWRKLCQIVKEVSKQKTYPIVIKLHPTLKTETEKPDKKGNIRWDYYKNQIKQWKSSGIKVFEDFESIHEILPHSRVAIVENSTTGIECLLHEVPIISYGYPEYHWVTFDLRHLGQLYFAMHDLSWWNKSLANSWLTWYCTVYQCYDYDSTFNRLNSLVGYANG